jgi:hypothetical protein
MHSIMKMALPALAVVGKAYGALPAVCTLNGPRAAC